MLTRIQGLIRKISYLFHPIGLLVEIILFHTRISMRSSKYLITSYLVFGGVPGSLFSKWLGSKPVRNFSQIENFLIASKVNIDNSSLRRDGFVLVEDAISQHTVTKLLDISLTTLGSYRGMDSGKGLEENVYFDRQNPKTIRFDVDSNRLFQNEVVQELASDPKVLNIAQDYLGTLPVLDFVAMWWHTKSDSPDKEAAQYFHFDMERLRWIKFFFYITDVDKDSGPHVFVPKSHRDFGLPIRLRALGYTRLEDQQVEILYPKNSWKEFIGPKGSMIVEDTRGLHKGKHVTSGDRLVFQLQYTSSLFGKKIDPITLPMNSVGSKLEVAMKQNPGIFQQIKIVG